MPNDSNEPTLAADERAAQTFPRLDPELVAIIARYGTEEILAKDTLAFRQGDRAVDFFVVLAGSIEIADRDPEGLPRVFAIHRERQFTGDVDLFSGREVLVDGRAGTDTRVIRVRNDDFRRLVAAEPEVSEVVTRAFILRRVALMRHSGGGGLVIGSEHSGDTLRIERFLQHNGYPHRFIDVDSDPDAAAFRECLVLGAGDLPVVVRPDHRILRNPSNAELADALGLMVVLDESHVFDLTVVGAGPAGLAAAVYGASEGLDVLVIEGHAPGGQAGTSSKIENYLGFPTGISGQALAGRAQVQAQKFGARLAVSRHVVGIECESSVFGVRLDDGRTVRTRAVVVATGARYRRLALDNFARLEGAGIHFAATAMEQQLCAGSHAVVVGGGNSAGQAAMYLSRKAAHVHILIRGAGLSSTMSSYLVQRIEATANITLHTHTEVVALDGASTLERVTWRDRRSGATETHDIRNLFVMIGAEPNTDWLRGCVDLDDAGFVRTGVSAEPGASPYAASHLGVWAVGDVRAGSVKRVASAVGEGSVVVQAIHRYLHPGV